MLFEDEAKELKKSHWPQCDTLVERLVARGASAADALEFASKARTHHVRSACLRALITVDPHRGKRRAEEMMSDDAYEVREIAASILGLPVKEQQYNAKGSTKK